ncbi:protein ACCELERATED CELL DEATH 6-like [Syzygium oleosum]|uniref:protein ACCELERATED CELL DEATH 6-like n=1 Tax=Syzygium oleosum TaxID=219896 RepID=UPI0024B949BB|nr:protein ACCELERATED CELL DEATH 6-like [Syzygium oleosum]
MSIKYGRRWSRNASGSTGDGQLLDSLMGTQSSMEVEISIEEENVGTDNSIKEELKKDEEGAFKEKLEDEMDSLKEEEIWRSRRERINNALEAARNTERQDPAEVYAVAGRLASVILSADVKEFVSEIERLANQTDPSAVFNCLSKAGKGSLLHIALYTSKDDILRLLLDYVPGDIIAAQNDRGDTPLHVAIMAKRPSATAMLIRRIKDLPNIEDKNKILRMKNRDGNTALHEAVLNRDIEMVRHLSNEDLEPVYWKNADQASPLYLAIESPGTAICEVLFSLPLEPYRIQGLPPIHGAIIRLRRDLVDLILKKNMELFAMNDSRGGNVFHLAAYLNIAFVFELLGPETEHLVQQPDMNGDLPIHIASKRGYVDLIEKLLPISTGYNGRGQNIVHVAAKYGRTKVVKYVLRHPELWTLTTDRDHAGNTPLHLAAMYSQPAALIPLVLDKRINLARVNHESLTAFAIAQNLFIRAPTIRKRLTLMVLASSTLWKTIAVSRDLLILRPEARDDAFSYTWRKSKLNMDDLKDVVNTRLLVATLVATVTFAAGFAVPGGFNGSDTASKDDRGMATMLDKRLFQAFAICNTIAMFCSMTAVINLVPVEGHDFEAAVAALRHSMLPLAIALPAMSVAFLTGVTLTVGKLPWLANTIFYLGLVFLLIISGATLIEYPPFLRSHHRPIRRLIFWLVLAYIYLWGVGTHLLDDSEEDGTASGTSASRPPDGAGDRMTDNSATAKCEDVPRPPRN